MKVMLIGDLHFGERGDSRDFNQHILDFIDWVVEKRDSLGVTHVVQLGDWFHHRNKIQVQTLSYGIEGAKRLGAAFGRGNVYVLEGNHDLYYLDRLDVSSVTALKPYVTVVDKPTTILEDFLATPWIVSPEQWDEVVNSSTTHKYLLAHLELNGFKVNDAYTMEHGLSHKELKDFEIVFTGHYHSPQIKDNILYTGTPYPITMNEANEDHGVYVFDTDTEDLQFFKYDGIRVISVSFDELSELDIESLPHKGVSIRVEFPDDIEDESLIEKTREILAEKNFEEVKIKYRGQKAKQLIEADVTDVEFVENIDSAVIGFIENSAEVEGVDKDVLKLLYHAAVAKGDEIG